MADNRNCIIRTVCGECNAKCGMLTRIHNGEVVELMDDPASPKGLDKLCWKAAAGLERLYHPDRLNSPLKRVGERGEGKWEPISWEDALDTIASRFLDLKATQGAESVAFVKGHYDRRCDLISRLGNAFGTPNITGIDNTCYIPSASGRLMTYGFDGRPDFSGQPECVLCWGNSANPPLKEGAKFIVVNSLRTTAAEKADLWLQPRPGSDLALAMGIIYVIVSESLFDAAFVEDWTIGFEALKDHARQYPLEHVSEVTWVPEDKIRAAARIFSEARPACLHMGNASEDTINSTQFARAISIIQAITGNLDVPGGTISNRGIPIDNEGSSLDVLADKLSKEQREKRLGWDFGHFPTHPLWDAIVNKPAELQSQYLIKSILEREPYQIQAAFVLGANPVMTWCDSKRVCDAFKQIPFLVVTDLVMTPTAFLADIVLPASSYLESDGVVINSMGYGDTSIRARRKTVQINDRKSDMDIIFSLATRLGLGDDFWPDTTSYLDDYLKKVGVTFEELCRFRQIVLSGVTYRKFVSAGFNTPTGKVELSSSLCEKWGYEALPQYHEPKETPFSEPEMLADYPLILMSAHDKNYTHSQDRYLKTIRDKYPEPLVEIHPDTASRCGIADGDRVAIENKRGRIIQRARLTQNVDPRVINVAYGWWFPEKGPAEHYGWQEANINLLSDDGSPYSPEIGSPTMRGFLCAISKV